MEGKIITCCGDCVYYDWKKHRCKNGHNDNSNPRKHFYSDCKTLLDLEEHDKQIIDEIKNKLRLEVVNGDVCWEDIEYVAEQLKEQNK